MVLVSTDYCDDKKGKFNIWKVSLTSIIKTPCGKVQWYFYHKNHMSLYEERGYKLWAYIIIPSKQGCYHYSSLTIFKSMLDQIKLNMFVELKMVPNLFYYMHIRAQRVLCVAPMVTLYINIPDQVYVALQSYRGQGKHIGHRRTESETLQGRRAAGELGRTGLADGKSGRGGGRLGGRKGEIPSRVGRENPDTAIVREYVGVRWFLRGGYGGGRGADKKEEIVRLWT